ncbi:MAG: diguanylate cyclase with sensor [Firmicutes bacterium]|nr:diguanylate cyclase with sensor [Bacillota bacterium]
MASEKFTLMKKRWFLRALPWLIIVIGLVVTWLQVSQLRQHEIQAGQAEFEIRASELVAGLELRMISHAQIVRGVASLFNKSSEVTRDEFHGYSAGLQLSENYPGIQGIGYTKIIPASEKMDHVAALRAEGFANYDIWPAGERDPYSAVVFVEPFNWRNQRALGYDMFLEPIRTKAAMRARDEGRVAISDKVTLVQETERDVQAGVLMFMPVYRQGFDLGTVEQRRAAILGWTYLPLRIKDFMDSYLKMEYADLSTKIAIQIYSGSEMAPAALMYGSHPEKEVLAGSYQFVQKISVYGTTWTVAVVPLPGYWANERIDKNAQMVMIIGIFLALILALVAKIVINSFMRVEDALQETTRANRSLVKQEELLRAIYDTSGVAVQLIGVDGKIAYANQRTVEMFQYPLDELLGTEFFNFILPEYHGEVRKKFTALITGQVSSITSDRRYWRKNNTSEFWGRTTGRAFHDADGNINGIVVVIEDITELRKTEAAMRLASTVFDTSTSGILVTDADRRIISVNPALTRITGYAPEDVLGHRPREFFSGVQSEHSYQEMWQTIEQIGYWEGEFLNRRKNGQLFPAMLSISRVVDPSGVVVNYVGMFMDITERRKAEEKIYHLAHHDYLTGLPNRALLVERATQALVLARRYNRQMAIIFIDLDRFKPINDEYGHDVGDTVLRTIAERLQAIVRISDTVCRQGGDEFVILLPEITGRDGLEKLAQELLAAIRQPCEVGDHRLIVQASIGIAVYPDHGNSVDAIIQRADSAMYRAKADIEKHICFARN